MEHLVEASEIGESCGFGSSFEDSCVRNGRYTVLPCLARAITRKTHVGVNSDSRGIRQLCEKRKVFQPPGKWKGHELSPDLTSMTTARNTGAWLCSSASIDCWAAVRFDAGPELTPQVRCLQTCFFLNFIWLTSLNLRLSLSHQNGLRQLSKTHLFFSKAAFLLLHSTSVKIEDDAIDR